MSRTHASIDPELLLAEVGWVRRIARSLVADASSADDLAQETLRIAIQHPPASVPSRSALRGWLARVSRTLALKSLQHDAARGAREQLAAQMESRSGQGETEARIEFQQRLVEAIRSLEEPYRSAIRRRYLDDVPLRELARIQGISYAAARQRVSRGIAMLRARLDRDYGERRLDWAIIGSGWAERGRWVAPLAKGVIVSTGAKLAGGIVVVVGIVLFLARQGGVTDLGAPPVPRASEALSDGSTSPDSGERPPASEAGTRTPVAGVSDSPVSSTSSALQLAGRVQDHDGRAVASAAIRLQPWSDAVKRYDDAGVDTSGVSDSDGRFELPAPTVYCRVVAENPGWTTVMPFEYSPGRVESDALVVVGPRNEYGGSIVDENGKGMADVSVLVVPSLGTARSLIPGHERSPAREWRTTSDSEGRFDLKNVGWTPGLELRAESTGRSPAKLALPVASDLDLRVAFAAGADSLAGCVVDADGIPAPQAAVYLDATPSVADAQGRFAFPTPDLAAAHTLVAVKRDHLPARIEFGAGKELQQPLVLVLGGPPLAISGRTVDAQGRAIANASVWIDDKTYLDRVVTQLKGGVGISGFATAEDQIAGSSRTASLRSDAEGRFELKGLLPRAYSISASDPRTLAMVTAAAVEAGTQDLALVLEDQSPAPRVAGRVLSLSGQPIADVRVFVHRTIYTGPNPVNAPLLTEGVPVTDVEGRFAFESLHLGETTLLFSGERVFAGGVRFELDPAQDLEHLEIRLPLKCSLQVRLADPAEADHCSVLDEKGRALSMFLRIGNSSQNSHFLDLADGVSEVASAPETARWLVLYSGKKEVRRVPIQLRSGEITQLRP